MRKFIGAMQISLDSKVEGPDGYADWVPDWGDTYDLIGEVDACLLGANMYPGYEQYWSAIAADPAASLDLTGKRPAPAEVEYATFAASKPHFVLSHTTWQTLWPTTQFLARLDEVRQLKETAGKAVYVVGGAETISRLLDEGLINELRLTLHPLIAGEGKLLFEKVSRRRPLELTDARPTGQGTVSLRYRVK
jgi:dihydrofolate reductase